jgi:hypothetical protein
MIGASATSCTAAARGSVGEGDDVDNKSPSSEELLRSLEPPIKRVEDRLRAALSGGQGDARVAFALRLVGLLRRFLEKIIEQVADQDLAEREAVYRLVTEKCAGFLDRPADLVYPAVLRLFGESDANLTDGLPDPDPEVVSSLEKVLLQVTVTYSLKEGGERAERTVLLLLHDVHKQQVRDLKVVEEMSRENAPEDVREKFVRDRQQPVAFTLYSGGR